MKQPKISGIYKIMSPIGKIYVGKAKDIKGRWASHRSSPCKTIKLLHESFTLFGVSSHVFEIIEECEVSRLIERERYWVSFLNTFKTEHGLNLSKGGSGCSEWSEETRRKSANRRNPMQGRKHTPESIAKMSKAVKQKYKDGYISPTKGMVHTEDAKIRMGLNKKGEKNWSYGRKMSQETRDKLKIKLTGLKRTEETKRRISESKKGVGLGRKHSAESKIKMSLAQKGHKGFNASEKTREKMRRSNLKRPGVGASKFRGVRGFNATSEKVNGIKVFHQWYASIKANGKNKYLGLFRKEEDAAAAYNIAAKRQYGEYANLNII